MSKKHVITKLKLNEISGVDNPAQPGATVALMKRADPPKEDPNPALETTTMFKNREELLAAIAKALTDPAYATANQVEIMKAATTLGALADVPQSISKAAPTTDPTVLARLEKSEKISGLTGVQKSFYDALPTDTAKDAFLSKSDADRNTDISKAAGDDPVVYTTLDGTDIRKSAGELLIALAKKADKSERDLAGERAERLNEKLAKRAEDELSNFTGTVDVRKSLLKAVDSIADETVRAEVLKSLTAANTAMGGAFVRKGALPGSEAQINKSLENPEEQLDTLAKSLQKADPKLAYHEAYSKALETPEGRELYAATANGPAQ